MRKHISIFAFVVLGAAVMYGQATRTWVSGVGDDANPCSRTAPCKTFAGAISKTAPGGEIDALDPGGFGALTITKSITLDGGGGQVASVLVAGTNGIVVAAGATDVVIIRNLRLDGLCNGTVCSNAGLNGLRFISGLDLEVENCEIFGFSQMGIDIELGAAGSAHILNCVLQNNGKDGILATTTTGQVQVSVDRSSVSLSGGQATTSGGNGIEAGANSRVVVSDSVVTQSKDSGVAVTASSAQAAVSTSDITFNNTSNTPNLGGLMATATSSANSFSSNYAYNNACSISNNGANSVVSFGGNRYIGSVACGTISPVGTN